jgi:hypothetical protein
VNLHLLQNCLPSHALCSPRPGEKQKASLYSHAERERGAGVGVVAGGGGGTSEFIVVFAESDGVSSALSTSGISILSP